MLSITGCASNGDVERLEKQGMQLALQVIKLREELGTVRYELR